MLIFRWWLFVVPGDEVPSTIEGNIRYPAGKIDHKVTGFAMICKKNVLVRVVGHTVKMRVYELRHKHRKLNQLTARQIREELDKDNADSIELLREVSAKIFTVRSPDFDASF
jgi:hypothetical protein